MSYPASSIALSTPIWAIPFALPPLNSSPTFGRFFLAEEILITRSVIKKMLIFFNSKIFGK